MGIERVCRVERARRAFFLSALSRAALVGYSVRCLRSWDLHRTICWAQLRVQSRTSSKRGELQGSSLCAQREAGLVARCSLIRANRRLRPGRTKTEAEALLEAAAVREVPFRVDDREASALFCKGPGPRAVSYTHLTLPTLAIV